MSFLGIVFIAAIVLLIVNVYSTGTFLPTAVATRINLPENLRDSVKILSGSPPLMQSTEKVVIQGTPYLQLIDIQHPTDINIPCPLFQYTG